MEAFLIWKEVNSKEVSGLTEIELYERIASFSVHPLTNEDEKTIRSGQDVEKLIALALRLRSHFFDSSELPG